jgi:hypothetical protein
MEQKKRKNFIYCNSVAAHPHHLMGRGLNNLCFKHNVRTYLFEYRKIMKRKNREGFEYDW